MIFESKEQFDKKYFITTFPVHWEEEKGSYRLGSKNTDQVIQLEIVKKIFFTVEFPFHVSWQSSSHVTGLIIKSFIANLPESISNMKVQPIGKIKEKNNATKDSLSIIIQLTNVKPNGTYDGTISYTFKPKSWLLNNEWGSKNDYERKIIQKYTTEQKYWRLPKEFETLVESLRSIDDVFTIAKEIYNLAKKTISIEHLDYRKGVLNLLHDMRGDCDEFTDLMVVLLRKLSFPVRRVTGMTYDYLNGTIVHHAWPEIFSPKYQLWIPIDAAMNFFGYQSLTIIPQKIEGTTILPNTLEVSILDSKQKVDLDVKLLDVKVDITLLEPD